MSNKQLQIAIRGLQKLDKECRMDTALRHRLGNEPHYILRDIKALDGVPDDRVFMKFEDAEKAKK